MYITNKNIIVSKSNLKIYLLNFVHIYNILKYSGQNDYNRSFFVLLGFCRFNRYVQVEGKYVNRFYSNLFNIQVKKNKQYEGQDILK